MNKLIYIHDTLYWDNKPIDELNATERGELATYVNNLPDETEPDTEDSVDRDDVDNIARRLHELADELDSL